MRSTVSLILQAEADRLHAIAIREGLTEDNLRFLNSLISTYQNFVGAYEAEEADPENQGTDDLLKALGVVAERKNESRLPEERSETKPVGHGRTESQEEVPEQGEGSGEGQEIDSGRT